MMHSLCPLTIEISDAFAIHAFCARKVTLSETEEPVGIFSESLLSRRRLVHYWAKPVRRFGPNTDSVVDSIADTVLATDVSFGRLNRYMAKQKLNLI